MNEPWTISRFQKQIEAIYYERDAARGVQGTFIWLVEEIGEIARSLTSGEPGSEAEAAEFADALAWLSTLASLRGIDLEAASVRKYGSGCPRCTETPCDCSHRQTTS